VKRVAMLATGVAMLALTACGTTAPTLPSAPTLDATTGTTACEIYTPGTAHSYLRTCSPREVSADHTLPITARSETS